MSGGWVLAFALVLGGPAYAQSKNVAKAEKMLAKYEAGTSSALAKAWTAIGEAKSHPDSRDDATTWVVLARVTTAWDGQEGSPVPDSVSAALDAWDAAAEKDESKAHATTILEATSLIEATALSQATNAYEGGRFGDARVRLATVRRAQEIVRRVGKVDPTRELDALRLSVLTAVELGELKDARAFHAALYKAGGRRAGTALQVTNAIAKKEGPDAALEFLAPLSDADPGDAAMFERRVELLTAANKPDGVRALLVANEGQLGSAMGITLAHARAWRALGDGPKTMAVFQRAYELDPRHQDVLRGFAEVEMSRGRELGAKAKAAKKSSERKALTAERTKAFEHARDLLQKSRELDPTHLETLKRLREVYDEVQVDDKEEIQALDQAIQDAETGI
jgi:tetratricopeptide (TPR) repeat protein